jgi:putative modified peptide
MSIELTSVSDKTRNNSMSRSRFGSTAESGHMSKDQVRLLLEKLGSDDLFRQMYEESPALALKQIGVAAEFIEQMKTRCLAPNHLAPKNVYRAASQKLTEEAAQAYSSFLIPSMRIGMNS